LIILDINVCTRTFWDAIFKIGFNPVRQEVKPKPAGKRLEKIFQLNTLISEHLMVDENLLFGLYEEVI
jgi:hypothetical protein